MAKAIIYLLFCYCCCLLGQERGIPFIKNFKPNEYGFNPQNFSILQDRRGMMMAGGGTGVLEFDGKTWLIHNFPTLNGVQSLASDEQGRIFIGSINELGYLAYDASGKTIYVSLLPLIPRQYFPFNTIWSTFATPDGIYFNTAKAIFHLDHKNRLDVIPCDFFDSVQIGYVSGQLLFNKKDGQMVRLSGNRLLPLPLLPSFPTGVYGQPLAFSYGQREILIVTQKDFFIYDTRMLDADGEKWGFSADHPPYRKFSTEVNEYLKTNTLYCGCRVNDHCYAFGTRRGGIIFMDQKGNVIQVINKNRGLQDNCIFHLYLDRQQNLWAAMNVGISFIETDTPVTLFNQFSGLDDALLRVIRHQGRIYVGTYNHGVMMLPEYKLQLTNDLDRFIQVGDLSGFCFCLTSVDDVLFAGVSYSLVQIKNGRIAATQGLSSIPMTITRSKRFPNHLFVGMWPGFCALELIRNQKSGWENGPFAIRELKTSRFKQIPDMIRDISSDAEGNLWLVTEQRGLFFLRFMGADVSDFTITRLGAAHGLPDSDPQMQLTHLDGKIFITSSQGVFEADFHPKTGENPINIRFTSSSRFHKQPLPALGTIMKIFATPKTDEYLLLVDKTLGFARREENNSISWNPLPFRTIQQGEIATYMEKSGLVWVPTGNNEGLYRCDPGINKNDRIDFSTLIRRVQVNNNKEIFSGSYYQAASRCQDHYLYPAFNQPENLVQQLPYRQNSLKFYFSATYYEHSQGNQFSCRLTGFEKGWTDWSTDGSAVYTNLPEGSFQFLVKAKNIYDWQSPEASFAFRILPPWQRTWWAYLGYALLAGVLFYGGLRLNSRRLQAVNIRLEKIISQRTAEVVRKNQELEVAYGDLYSTNRKLTEAKNALWGEMELAKKIQTVLLPEQPQIPGFEIAAYMKPADEVGGDYYDVISIVGAIHESPLHWVVIGDVSGHGVPAGLVMMMAQTALHTALDSRAGDSPEQILVRVNRILHQNMKKLGEDKYMTITLLSVQADGTFCFSGLHQDIMIYRSLKKAVELVETRGIWIGLMDAIDGMIGLEQFTLQPGDVMLLYTDGLVEAVDSHGQMFSQDRLAGLLQRLGAQSLQKIHDDILQALTGYTCSDDVTWLIVRRLSAFKNGSVIQQQIDSLYPQVEKSLLKKS